MDFLRVPLSVAAGWIVFAEAADLTLALGAGLILAGNALNLNRGATTRAGFGRPRDD
jgi:drug/metabolite transporter (DMT)-like permease